MKPMQRKPGGALCSFEKQGVCFTSGHNQFFRDMFHPLLSAKPLNWSDVHSVGGIISYIASSFRKGKTREMKTTGWKLRLFLSFLCQSRKVLDEF